ncbi:hypothetical protein JJB67_09640 [Clostridium perfringens]|uniref:hypothetical protein n=1 Tax=Clostridium perfringens TaxID=1502 RepID=UPI000D711676|nr:hypothetical protein [Clostridium perfringens]MBO3322834.1 hypothetical protein [Clostridium perfringens]MBO3331757.1 hypothetical protein [Clostridium perfringens]PWW99035.1 hypothetical protein CYK73_13985 [Clostridium perfringens]PWW99765.1 hypothetical protein CYK75_10105 [Clostridium perfringens]
MKEVITWLLISVALLMAFYEFTSKFLEKSDISLINVINFSSCFMLLVFCRFGFDDFLNSGFVNKEFSILISILVFGCMFYKTIILLIFKEWKEAKKLFLINFVYGVFIFIFSYLIMVL